MHRIESRKPINGSMVIARTESGKLIPCFYVNQEFVKCSLDDDVSITQRICSVCEWCYEVDDLSELSGNSG